ncbi:helix-turn-helix domain-containing protein [Martelella alba]|uniref:Helix-turn-helix domain-containing protein n=1 Tax=Martelella alba TaxID=2590451 RepID=A0A506UCD0_9HYPH|nr:helix-turn-helix domain-containing protein [Martelella alba]TPW30319.1 helix-turn-helix domain-containing protein [Martelella alba]
MENDRLDLVWGAANIAAILGRSRQQAYNMLSKGELPAKKIGDRWVARRSDLERFFTEAAA